MNKVFKICFFLFSALCGMENNQKKGLYRKFLDNRTLGILTSAIVGGGTGAGLRYLLHKNKFLSSFRATEKIKHAPYFKFVGTGAFAAVGLYELLKRLTKPKQSDKSNWSARSRKNSEESEEEKPEKNYNEKIKVVYICPGSLLWLFNSTDGLKTETAKEIERILSEREIEKYHENEFWFCSTEEKFKLVINNICLKGAEYAAALYLVNEDQKESFINIFKESLSGKKSLSEEQSLLYDLYAVEKPTSTDSLWYYVLPLGSSVDDKGKKTYSLNFSSQITQDNIDSYSFKLPEEDVTKINLGAREIIGQEFKYVKR